MINSIFLKSILCLSFLFLPSSENKGLSFTKKPLENNNYKLTNAMCLVALGARTITNLNSSEKETPNDKDPIYLQDFVTIDFNSPKKYQELLESKVKDMSFDLEQPLKELHKLFDLVMQDQEQSKTIFFKTKLKFNCLVRTLKLKLRKIIWAIAYPFQPIKKIEPYLVSNALIASLSKVLHKTELDLGIKTFKQSAIQTFKPLDLQLYKQYSAAYILKHILPGTLSKKNNPNYEQHVKIIGSVMDNLILTQSFLEEAKININRDDTLNIDQKHALIKNLILKGDIELWVYLKFIKALDLKDEDNIKTILTLNEKVKTTYDTLKESKKSFVTISNDSKRDLIELKNPHLRHSNFEPIYIFGPKMFQTRTGIRACKKVLFRR